MRRNRRITLYCQDPNCDGWHGVKVAVIPDTWEEPGWIEPDYCTHCGQGGLEDSRPEWENSMAALLDELHCAGVITDPDVVEPFALFQAIHAELELQASERREAERAAAKRREPKAAIDRAFPPTEVLTW